MIKRLIFCLVLVSSFNSTKAQIDSTLGISAPKNATRDYQSLAHFLCDGLSGDREKANAVYNWITHNIRYDVKAARNGTQPREKQAEKALKHRLAVCEGYAMLFTDMCREAGLKAVNIDGYAKDWVFDNGDKLVLPRHMWSGVMVDGKWQLADPTWGAGYSVLEPSKLRKIYNKVLHKKVWYAKNLTFKFRYNPEYFLQDPLAFRIKHAPSDPLWQLTDTIMPLRVFEAGDSMVTDFNNRFGTLNQTSPKLTSIADLDERQKTVESADRVFAYNQRFPVIRAIKQIFQGAARVERAINDSENTSGDVLLKMADLDFKNARQYIKDQKDSIPSHYSVLKAKNKVKTQEAKKYVTEIKADDKKQIAAYNKYANSVDTKQKRIKSKINQATARRKGIYPGKINDIAVPKTQKSVDAPEMLALVDSYNSRRAQISVIHDEVNRQTAGIKLQDSLNNARLDSLANFIVLEDSALICETKERLAMHDGYDDEVKKWSRIFKTYKYQKTDTFLKYLLINFDTLTKKTDERQKTLIVAMNLYKKNIKCLEQYRKWNSSDTGFVHNYFECVQKYFNLINMYVEHYTAYNAYLNRHSELFAGLSKVTKQQLKIVAYMELAEEQRRKMEDKTLVHAQEYDTRENKGQSEKLAEIIEKMDEVTSKLN